MGLIYDSINNEGAKLIKLSPIVGISEYSRQIETSFKERTGKNFLHFERGGFDVSPPQYLREHISANLHLGRYPKAGGEPILKKAILDDLLRKGISDLSEDNIVITHGGQQGLEISFGLLQGAGVVGIGPIWSCILDNQIPYSLGGVKTVPFLENNEGMEVDYVKLNEALSDSNVLYLNHPQNPTGKVLTRDELTKINDICLDNETIIISDEAYARLVFDGKKHTSMLEFEGDHILTSFTFSKEFAAPGYRVGFLVTRDKKLIDEKILSNVEYTQTAGVPTPLQHGFAYALNDVKTRDSLSTQLRLMFQRRRDLMHNGLEQALGKNIPRSEGGLYYFVDMAEFIPEGVDPTEYFKNHLIGKNGMGVVPGEYFSPDGEYSTSVRLSFSQSDERTIEEGMFRLESVL